MKYITIFLALTFSVMFSSSSYAGWTKVGENEDGDTYYVDFERIRKVDGYVYYWDLTDYLKPTSNGRLSAKTYNQGDCELFRYKYLSYSFHKEPMGGGTGDTDTVPDKEWRYPPPNSVDETILKSVCNR
jgi:hypothetical protein